METLLITGSNGLLGAKLIEQAEGRYRVVGLSRQPRGSAHAPPVACFRFHQLDICDGAGITALVQQLRPATIIHTAAMTNVDDCERRPQEAWEVNTAGTENVARASRDIGARLVFISTDYVFSGERGPYQEDDPTDPISVYGRTKLEAEKIVSRLCPDAVVARTSTLLGHSPGVRPNFVTWLVEALSGGQQATVATDQTSSPTLADHLASMLLTVAESRVSGVFHTVGAEWLSRYDLALRICKTFSLDPSLIIPAATDALQQAAPRPRHSGLMTNRLQEEIGIQPLSVDEALSRLKRVRDMEQTQA